MQELIRFLNQGWIGTLVGTTGVAVALFLYWRSRISGIIAWQSRDVSMIGSSDAVFPSEVEVQYRETPVSRIISSTVWIWNAGKKTVRGVDIVAHDPLRLSFDGEILDIRIKKVSREVLRITAAISEEVKSAVCFGFEFLDPGDGGVLEVLHTGSNKVPKCTGTIMGLPNGIQHWGASASSERERRINRLMWAMIFIMGLGMTITGIIGEQTIEQYVEEALPFFAEPPELPSWLSRGFLLLFGPLISLFSVVAVWILGHRAPLSASRGLN